MRKVREWPNGLGFDIRTSGGVWEVLKAVTSLHPWRVRFIPRGEKFASRYGEGATMNEALAVAVPVQ